MPTSLSHLQNTNVRIKLVWRIYIFCVANQMLPIGSDRILSDFLRLPDDQQRSAVNDVTHSTTHKLQKTKAEEYIRLFFEIVKKVKGNQNLITFALLMIDGILEDNRSRIQHLVGIQRSHKKEKKEDLINILTSFLYQGGNQRTNEQRDLATHILAMLIEAVEYKNCQ